MAVTLNSTGIVFSNATAQSSKTQIGAVQYGGYQSIAIGGQAYNTTASQTTGMWAFYGSNGITGDSSSTVHCGWEMYRYSNYNSSYSGDSSLDGPADVGLYYARPVYRSISI